VVLGETWCNRKLCWALRQAHGFSVMDDESGLIVVALAEIVRRLEDGRGGPHATYTFWHLASSLLTATTIVSALLLRVLNI
jgi:hypothetical protein